MACQDELLSRFCSVGLQTVGKLPRGSADYSALPGALRRALDPRNVTRPRQAALARPFPALTQAVDRIAYPRTDELRLVWNA